MTFAIIVDLNGTLADCQHRAHYIKSSPKKWDAYYAGMVDDPPITPTVELVRVLSLGGGKVVVWSGHPDIHYDKASSWLTKHAVPFDRLMMRKHNDFRKDTEIKVEMLAEIRASGLTPTLVIEDRMSVANTMRAYGLVCLHCTDNWE